MADAALAAFRLLDDERYLATFGRAHGWFEGQNSLGMSLVDVRQGSCCDGLQETCVNQNQGAESTLAWLWTQAHQHEIQQVLADDRRTRILIAGNN